MKLIESDKETVSLCFSREEFTTVRDAVSAAIDGLEREPGKLRDLIEECAGIDDPEEVSGIILDAGRQEETVEQLERSLRWAEHLLPKVYNLSDGLMRIV